MGDILYKQIQKRFGRLNADPVSRLRAQMKMACWIAEVGMVLQGKRVLEVGTGHMPIVPVGFFLCGAESVTTVDLHRRLDVALFRKSLEWMACNKSCLENIYSGVVAPTLLSQRFALIEKMYKTPLQFLKEADIRYLAPADAAAMAIPEKSVDFHISNTVLEHISKDVIKDIFCEAKRILKKEGTAIHFIDLSDHFQHQDNSIKKIHFLKFPDKEWLKIAGNQFGYCNRLRVSDYLSLFDELLFVVMKNESNIDSGSVHALKNGFIVDDKFIHKDIEDICLMNLDIMLRLT
jgi:SAM-dependent methyltransferase